MSGNGRETLQGDPPGCPRVVGVPYGYPGVVGIHSWMSESGRIPSRKSGNGWVALPNVRERSRVLPGCLAIVGRPYRMCWSGREFLPVVQEWS